jgi:hypothetical protein
MDAFIQQGGIQSYGVTPDGSRFVMVREGAPSQQSELVVALNWLQLLKEKSPR